MLGLMMETKTHGGFFRRIDYFAFWVTALVSFILYFATLAPTITIEDAGELAVAAIYLGVPHPPGYPAWTLINWLFQLPFQWIKYYGQPANSFAIVFQSIQELLGNNHLHGYPNPAWTIALSSAFFGALGCGILAMLVCRSGADMLRGAKELSQRLGHATEDIISWTGGVTAGLLLAFSPVMWSQSVIVEVYSLNAFFQLLLLLLLYHWICQPKKESLLFYISFLFGLGLTNHQTLLFLGAGLAVGVLLRDIRLFRDYAIVGSCFMVLIFANYLANRYNYSWLSWLGGPTTPAFWVYLALAILIPFGGLLLPNGKTVCISFLLFELGLSFYLYMPIAALHTPPMNWGYTATWGGFLREITRAQYAQIILADIFSRSFFAQVGSYLVDLRGQFTLPIVIIGFLPFCAWELQLFGHRIRVFIVALILAILAILFVIAESCFEPTNFVAKYICLVVYRHLIGGILLLGFVGLITIAYSRLRPSSSAGQMGRSPIRVSYLIPPALLSWLIVTMAAFFSLGIVLVAFQNPSLDLLNLFVGRVQFIQSHAIYAIWLGYGIIFVISSMANNKWVRYTLIILALALPSALLYQNYFDEEQITIVGGAEQNGHDFGWQFGHGILCGAQGIMEDASPTERATYPNPNYPSALGTNAIYFGGTDPGRFIPTYMVYGAKLRQDVLVLSQNGMADQYYVNSIRDLLGDRLWFPPREDDALAYQTYLKEMKLRRETASRLSIGDNSQILKRLGDAVVREIFEHNKANHPIYYEESIIIPWMYPYLIPHGLIMQLNPEPMASLPADVVQNDRKFWDWYEARLMKDPAFLRDIPARITFSKLRTAISGIYEERGMYVEREYALRQALRLYPLATGANYYLLNLLQRQNRYKEEYDYLLTLIIADPHNDYYIDRFYDLILIMSKVKYADT